MAQPELKRRLMLRNRIILGLAPIFILLIAMGIYAVSLFAKLGGAVDVILRENFRSVLAAQNMKEAAERMDSALFFSLVGEEQRGRQLYEQNLPAFRENLNIELNNITLPGEREMTEKIASLHERYVKQAETFWNTNDPAQRRQMYFGEMLPTFTEIKDTADRILRINQDAMVRADRGARVLSATSIRYMIIAIGGGLVIAVFFAVRLQRSILRPIRALTASSKELGEGNLDQVVPVVSHDELGQLADAFNKMAGKLRAYRQITSDQILHAKQMTEITFSAFPDAIVVLSHEGKIDFKNPAADRLFARLGKDYLPSPVMTEAERVLKGGADFLPTDLAKALCLRLDDKETFILPRVIGMNDEHGGVFGAAVVLQDVTRFRLLDDVKTNLVSTVSHELKTPLTSVRMGLHLLLEEKIGALTPKQTELLLAAREDSERLLRMINDLLDLARIESGSRRMSLERHSPNELVQKAASELVDLAEAGDARLKADVEAGLPDVAVEPQQILHVFSNFVSNAAKYSRAGEEIVIGARRDSAGGVRFSVTDHGPGIPLQYQPRMYEKFFRVPGTDSRGAGLGLAIAREIVTAHDGRVGVNSHPGKGSEFYFVLPAAEATTRPAKSEAKKK
jgi:two-component system, NtrC family, sensor histidine kinase KinB